MTSLSPWAIEREHAAAPTPVDAEGYAPHAAPACWVRRPVGGALDYAIVLWRDARRGWLLRLGPQHKFHILRLDAWVHRMTDADAKAAADEMLDFYGYLDTEPA